jgi:DNA-binding beta-propeller fold protein YncE
VTTCPNGHDNPEGPKFCTDCGAAVVAPPPTCPNGHETPDGRRFCNECGAAIAAPPPTATCPPPPTLPPPPLRPPPPPGTSPPPRPRWHRQRRQVKLALIAAVVVVLAAAGITGYLLWPSGCGPRCVALPFTGLNYPVSVAVDSAGNVYVSDSPNNRVVKLAAGSSTQTVLPFTGLVQPTAVAVDTAGNLYVIDSHSRVLKLAAG